MYISKFKIANFKSFRDSANIELKPGFNIVTGQNSAGKTALLEALTLRFAASPHRSTVTIPVPGVLPHPVSSVRVTLVLSGAELLRVLRSGGPDANYVFPALDTDQTRDSMDKLLEQLVQTEELRLEFRYEARQNGSVWIADSSNFLGVYTPETNRHNGMKMHFNVLPSDRGLNVQGDGYQQSPDPVDVRAFLASRIAAGINRFKAERFNLGRCSFGVNHVLAPDASNLPEV